jgi:osmoprotectant transport system permease protein
VLALAADQLLGLVETALRLRRPLLGWEGLAGLAVGAALALLPLAGLVLTTEHRQ